MCLSPSSHFFHISFLTCILFHLFRSTCLAIVDSGTSGIGIPTEYYETILSLVTNNMKCKDVSCVNVKEVDFPIILISLDPDSTFPLLPSDYVECSGMYLTIIDVLSIDILMKMNDIMILCKCPVCNFSFGQVDIKIE